MMNRIYVSMSIAALALGGCATVFKSKTTPITVTSATPGAQVSVGGRSVGVTPTTVELTNAEDATITVTAAGKAETCQLTSKASVGWIVADVFLTSGLGLIIDLVTHNANNLAPESCHVGV